MNIEIGQIKAIFRYPVKSKVGLQIELVGIEKLFHRRGAESAEEAQRPSA
jgi:hypothetical protein